ncbi:MAG TPA: EI24 domain-containing protein [Sphingomonadales bacterium]
MFTTAVTRTISQLTDPIFLKVLAGGVVLAIVSLLAAAWGAGALTDAWFHSSHQWLDILLQIAAGLAVLWLGFFIFAPLSAVFVGLFSDAVVDAVERRHYPARQSKPLGIVTASWLGIRLGLIVIVANLLALPVFVIALVIPGLPFLLFWLLNAYLLSWGLYDLVAPRHLPPAEVTRHRRAIRGPLFVTGIMVAALFSIPFVNLVAPIFGAAMMVHIFHATYYKSESHGAV